jgi:hypothetical protein
LFSVFTHLYIEETGFMLQALKGALEPKGKIVADAFVVSGRKAVRAGRARVEVEEDALHAAIREAGLTVLSAEDVGGEGDMHHQLFWLEV